MIARWSRNGYTAAGRLRARVGVRLRRAADDVRRAGRGALADDRGDVPGWVLVTLMTAGLVLLLWGLAGPALSGVFQRSIDQVSQEIGG